MAAILILEVGCGTTSGESCSSPGKYCRPFRPVSQADVYLDVNKPGLKIPNFVRADAQHLPFRDKSFSEVFASHVIEHLEDPERLLREARRVSTGRLHLYLPNFLGYEARRDVTHKRVFTYFSLRRMLRDAGYSNIFVLDGNISGRIPKMLRKLILHAYLMLSEEIRVTAF